MNTSARMFASLSAANLAVLRSRTEGELFQRICNAAVDEGKFIVAAVLAMRSDRSLQYVAGAGIAALEQANISADHGSIYGNGLAGAALRHGSPQVSNACLQDTRLLPWHDIMRQAGVNSAAAIPILASGSPYGVLYFCHEEPGSLDDPAVRLMEKLAANISFALDNFSRERERARSDEARKRIAEMFTVLSATNEAIFRSESAAEMFQLVCDAAVAIPSSLGAAVFSHDLSTREFSLEAGAGRMVALFEKMRLSSDPTLPEGHSLHGPAFRTGKVYISNDVMSDPRTLPWKSLAIRASVRTCAALPLVAAGSPMGIFVIFLREAGWLDEQGAELMGRISENVSFGLERFAREEDRRKAAEQKEKLTRMLSALTITNEAIMRSGTREELFQQVCAAVSEKTAFRSTSIVLPEPDEGVLRTVAAAGPDAHTGNIRVQLGDKTQFSGQRLCLVALRSGRAAVSNDFQNDPRLGKWDQSSRERGVRSGAAFPLFAGKDALGAILFHAGEKEVFDGECMELLQRLADNLSLALENLALAEEKSQADGRIAHMATHDGLTELPNRTMFTQLLHFSIEAARRHKRKFAVLFIDLDRFKTINDSLGHEAGDKLLIKTAQRLRQAVRSSDVVARLGGDEFVVVLDTPSRKQVGRLARELLGILSNSIELCGHECHTTASIGIAIYPDDGSDVQSLTKNADMAMYQAKEDGKNGFRFFATDTKVQSIERLSLEAELRHALDRDQLTLEYQPKLDMKSGRISGVEALLRWTHPTLGAVPPMQFIPVAEEIGLIVPIGRWILHQACQQAVHWDDEGLPLLSMAVNLSPRQFTDELLLRDIDAALARSGLSGERLQLEITESTVMRNVARATRLLEAIRARGIRLAIDDFGTGYSSMSLMKQFPIDTIKIDRSFVRDLPKDSEDRAIAQAIISMGKALGMTVVAEGVETPGQEAFLKDHSCDEMQGFLFSRPVKPDVIPSLLSGSLAATSSLKARLPPLRSIADHRLSNG